MEKTENESLVDLNVHPLVFPEEASDREATCPRSGSKLVQDHWPLSLGVKVH